MKRTTASLVTIVLLAICPAVFALYSVSNEGTWPKSWPKELEPLRKQAKTLVGPMVPSRHYIIPFTKREEFEAAWPHILEIKSKGAPIILVRGPKTDFFAVQPAGVIIHTPPLDIDRKNSPEGPIPGISSKERWMNTTYIELVVDGDVVDLNRIPLPADTPIIDERFKESKQAGGKKASDDLRGYPAGSLAIQADLCP
jgi:hypothetical protein